ncbi:MAG: DUF4349 domain-containing protein [Defluviitaleaceae bacterium]|nr:DUF4349 domain-containing protein [Defluviitaleaceae bacterium]
MKEYEQMSLYYDGELTGSDLEAFEKRLFEDPAFALEYESFAQVLVSAAGIPLEEPPHGIRDNIMKRVREEARPINLIGEKAEKGRTRRKKQGNPMATQVFAAMRALVFGESRMRSLRPYATATAAVVVCVFVVGALFGTFRTGEVATEPMPMQAIGVAPAGFDIEIYGIIDISEAQPQARAAAGDVGGIWVLDAAETTEPDILPEDLVVRSAWIMIEVDDIDFAIQVINGFGGYNENAHIWGGEWSNATIGRRVPLDQFNMIQYSLRSLGNVQSESESAHSVSAQLLNAQARRGALGTEIERLLGYLELSESVADLTLISARLAVVEQELLDAQGSIQQTQNSIMMPVMNISLIQAVDDGGNDLVAVGFWQDVGNSFIGSLRFTRTAFTELGVFIAWVALPALIMLVMVFVFGLVRRKAAKADAVLKGEGNNDA